MLDTTRLRIEHLTPQEPELLWQVDQDPEVMRYINGGKCTAIEDVHKVMIPRLRAYHCPSKGWGIYKVIERQSSQYLGWVLARPMYFFSAQREDSNLELGWRLKRIAWGHGYATEAAKAVISHIQQIAPVRQYSAIAQVENKASISVMKKLGMRYVKTYWHEDPLFQCEVVLYASE